MLAKKKSNNLFFVPVTVIFVLALLGAGCTPAGPRAALKGKRYLERGDYAGAAAEFKLATTLLATNANVWNYYGVALQGAGQPDDAVNAYRHALELDRDLMEAHYNLGNLWLEQNKPDQARVEFTAYTLRRNNDPAGWLKLGTAQLRSGDSAQAEKSFSAVLSLKPSDAEAYNGLGLARVQRGVPRDAAKFFAAAIQCRTNYGPAILNLATVDQQYLHDDKAALDSYHTYLNLNPRPANWDDVNALAEGLEKAQVKVAVAPPVERSNPTESEYRVPPPRLAPTVTASRQSYTTQDTAPPVRYTQHYPSATRIPPSEDQTYPGESAPPQPVHVENEQPIVTTPLPTPQTNIVVTTVVVTNHPTANQPPVEMSEAPPPYPKKGGFWHSVFGSPSYTKSTPAHDKYMGTGLTPVPPPGDDSGAAPTTKTSDLPEAKSGGSNPAEPAQIFARYNYFSPTKPPPGDHSVGSPAAGAFTKARLYEMQNKWTDALQWYEEAATLDPSWFEAQYNAGVLAHKLRNFALALPRYEWALAIQPDSVDARYNFALALKTAGFPMDAAAELKKILAANPGEVRAHLALANIYAQSLRDIPQAREHYQKVLALDPNSSQAPDIRFWLSANQK